ncbi:VOC family protein [Brevibacillus sp. SYSU BS000544]|uniref:VOC family protein n=1 Tax=Brevibacillus sp. SYSU BS000544 TaxID=3416443 RepID=UPI003CE4E4AB
MKLAFDHLVHFVNDHPAKAVPRLNQLGLHAIVGGRHDNWGTINALSYFDLSYIELLALEHLEVAEGAREYGLIDQLLNDLPRAEGFGTIALRTDNMEQSAEFLRSKGIQVKGPFPGRRQRSDGKVIKWKMLFLNRENGALPLPFLIEWEQSDEERRVDLTGNGIIADHPAGAFSFETVAFAVSDLNKSVAEFQELFGLDVQERFFDEQWNAVCQKLILPGGNLLFCQPEGEGVVAETLRMRGERPFLVQLSDEETGKDHHLWGSIYRF